MKTASTLLALLLLLAGCGTSYEVPVADTAVALPPAASRLGSGRTAADFRAVAGRIEAAGESFCREEAPGASADACNFRILLETDPRMPPNAFQTRTEDGRPIVVVGAKLLAEMQSDDELAFVLGHEMSHHIAGHLGKQQQQQMLGALIMGGLVAAGGNAYGAPASDDAIRQAMDLGAFVGGRAYSQSYELEADTLGAYITARAGYAPERGADIFGRPSLANPGGPAILATHPGSSQRQATVAQVAAEIRRQQAAGLVPRPGG
jgi:predicted Zn-dependent protease